MTNRRILIILGMHRSGTSMLARLCNLLGADLGPDIMPPGEDNPSGFWEHRGISELHDDILEAVGRGWDDPREMPPEWWLDGVLAPYRVRLKEMLQRDFGNSALPCVKDPRLCRLVPLWQEVLSELGWTPLYLLTARNPLEVIASLAKRNRFDAGKSALLWLRHMVEAESATRWSRRAFCSYESLLRDWQGSLRRSWTELELEWTDPDANTVREIADFVRADLRHHVTTAERLRADRRLAPFVGAVHQLYTEIERGGTEGFTKGCDEITRLFAAFEYLYRPLLADVEARAHQAHHLRLELKDVRRQLAEQRDGYERVIAELSRQLAEQRGGYEKTVADFSRQLAEQRDGYERTVADLSRQLAEQRDGYERTVADLSRQLATQTALANERAEEVARLRGDLAAERSELSRLNEERRHTEQDLREQLATQTALANERAEEVARLRGDLAAERGELSRLNEERRHTEQDLREQIARGQAYIQALHASTSWRITVPLRLTKRALLTLLRLRFLDRAYLRIVARELYYRLPLPWTVKHALRRLLLPLLRAEGDNAPADSVPPAALRAGDVDTGAAARLLAGEDAPPRIETSKHPLVSVIIPVHGKIAHTLHCLHSIAAAPPQVPYEVIIVDDCSPDDTDEVLRKIPGLQVVRNRRNLGFIGACNAGAAKARGEYVFFLNNDTAVQPGWLDELVETFRTVPEAGLVGSKLVYPDGRLQEAGGIVWQDGSAWNYGRFDDPHKPQYNYRRDVDYVSGAAIMLPTTLFRDLGGFDEHYSPAYYEDTDLAFRVRARGRRVIYQPLSVIVHYEGVTSGTDVAEGVKKHQVENQQKFLARWKDVLATHRPNGVEPELECERGVTRRALVVDACTPTPDQDAGSVIAFHYLKMLTELGYRVTFAPDNLQHDGRYTQALQRLGIECLYVPYWTSISEYIRQHGAKYQLAILARPYVAIQYLDLLREHSPGIHVIYNTVDLHYLRERRQAELEGNPLIAERAERTRKQELQLIRGSDATIVVSPVEKEILAKEVPGARVEVIQLIMEEQPEGEPFEKRRDILFIGGYQHPPNVDAVRWFVAEVMPLLRQKMPGVVFHALGSKPPPAVRELECDDVKVPGYLADVSPYFNSCKLMVAPLRYGAGIKGKIGTSFSYGLPVVASKIAVEGMYLKDGQHVLVAETAEQYCEAIMRLYRDKELWQRLSLAGRRVVRERYAPDVIRDQLGKLIVPNLGEVKKAVSS
ncbi:MAG TPA: glycosyltransferase [Gammaproteobacteria bacterium]|nr:glycosyltransferase [Gammaproteobacteria bacterium]